MAASLRIVAIMSAFNEADVIGQAVRYLIDQGIFVHVIDDGSTDDTTAVLEPLAAGGRLYLERRAPGDENAGPRTFEWTSLLTRKEQLARELPGDWFLHYDADEFRESPWGHLTLRDGIELVDRLGYNAIDFAVWNFWPTGECPDGAADVRRLLRYCEPAAEFDKQQVKCWKRALDLNLVSSGGHDATFSGRRIFPLRFLTRHYPIRSQAHGERKILRERLPRYSPDERRLGWHIQYDTFAERTSFVRDAASLRAYDPDAVRVGLQLEHRGVEGLEQHVERLEQDVERFEQDVKRLEQGVERLEQERETLRRAEAQLREQLERVRGDLYSETTARAHAERTSGELRDHLEAEAAVRTRALRDAESLRHEVETLRASYSWRITSPLRAIYGVFVGAPAPASNVSTRETTTTSDKSTTNPTPVAWGDLARVTPLSDAWGTDRGRPVDRYFIESFLAAHRNDIRGHVLEVKDAGYTGRFGGTRVIRSSVLDIDPGNAAATVVGDLSRPGQVQLEAVDCFILTQTLHIIYDIKDAIAEGVRLLAPGGVLLCTIPAVSRVNYENGGLDGGDYWRLTAAAVRRLFEETPMVGETVVETFGNVRTCAAFLYGLAVEEIPPEVRDHHDPWFPLVHGVRVVKRS